MVLSRGPQSVQKLIHGQSVRYAPSNDTIEILRQEGVWERIGGHYNLCLEVTTACNMTCRNCFAHSAAGKPGEFRDVRQLISDIEARRHDNVRVGLTGGEPLLHPNISDLIAISAEYPDLIFALNSNLTLRTDLDDGLVAGGWRVWTSLHGARNAHNGYTRADRFDAVVERIRGLAPRVPVRLNVVLHDAMSEKDVDWLYEFRDECDLRMLRFAVPRAGGRYVGLDSMYLVAAVKSRLDDRSELRLTGLPNGLIDVSGESRLTE